MRFSNNRRLLAAQHNLRCQLPPLRGERTGGGKREPHGLGGWRCRNSLLRKQRPRGSSEVAHDGSEGRQGPPRDLPAHILCACPYVRGDGQWEEEKTRRARSWGVLVARVVSACWGSFPAAGRVGTADGLSEGFPSLALCCWAMSEVGQLIPSENAPL